jgi:dolichol-phosphate mannosyltransferase
MMCAMTRDTGTSGRSTNASVPATTDTTAATAAEPAFAVVIPMFNEEGGAERCVIEVCRELQRLPNRSRLIIVDDGSTDGTAAVLHHVARGQPLLQVVAHAYNRGYGAALRTGVEVAHAARFDYVLFMDSDLTNSPRDIPRFVIEMARGADVVKATRYSGGGGVNGVAFSRWIISAVGNWIARVLFGLPIHDCTNGFRAIKVPLLMQMTLEEARFPVIMEELYWCRFLARTYAEVPVVLTSRQADQRPTAFAYVPSVFWSYLKYPLLAFLRRLPAASAGPRA